MAYNSKLVRTTYCTSPSPLNSVACDCKLVHTSCYTPPSPFNSSRTSPSAFKSVACDSKLGSTNYPLHVAVDVKLRSLR